MYSHGQYGDSQYPQGPEMGSMSGQVPIDPSRYPYMQHYGSKAPDSVHMAAVANRPPYGSDYSMMGNPEQMYNQSWMLGQGYMGPHTGKPGPYGMQGMPNYGASPGYPGGPHHYSSTGQYHPYGGSSQSHMPGSSHMSMMQQQGLGGHRFNPSASSSSAAGRSEVGNSGMAEGSSSYMGNVPPAGVHGHSGSGSPGPPWPPSQQLHPHGSGSAVRGYGKDQSPAPPSSTTSSGHGGGGGNLSYHSPEYPPPPGTPNSSQASAMAGSSSRLKSQDIPGSAQQGSNSSSSLPTSSSSSSQKPPVDLSSPRNSELPKAPSISCLREALLATTSITSTSQSYASYSSPRMMGGGEHQPSPLTPSSHHPPMTPESGSLLSPQSGGVKKSVSRQDSQLSSSSGHNLMEQEQLSPFSRQNSLVHHQKQVQCQPPGGIDGSSGSLEGSGSHFGPSSNSTSNSVPMKEREDLVGMSGNLQKADVAQGMKNDQMTVMAASPNLMGSGTQQSSSASSSPLANSTRSLGGGGGGLDNDLVSGSPRMDSPHNSVTLNATTAGTVGSERQSPAPARPDLLGFSIRSPSIRGEKQPSPLTEDTKNLSATKNARKISMSPIDKKHPSIASQYNGDQKRKDFLDLLFSFLEKEGVQVARLPTICKAPFDLYQIFNSVQHHGGFPNVVEKRLWRDVIKTAYGNTVNPTSSSVRTLQQYYKKLLLPYECHVGGSTEVLSCMSKIDNSAPSRTSTGSPCGSQISTDGDSNKTSSSGGAGDKLTNHLSEVPSQEKADSSKFPVAEGRMNGETLCAAIVEPGPLLDGEHVVERVNSQGNSIGAVLTLPPPLPTGTAAAATSGPGQTPEEGVQNSTNGDSTPKLGEGGGDPKHSSSATSSGNLSHMTNMAHDDGAPSATALKTVNSTELDNDRSLDFPDDSRDSYPRPELSDPLPEMSVQEAESVLGMSPTTYPNHDGPATPSTGVPSPSQFPPSAHFQKQQQQQQRVGSIGQPGTPGSVGTPTGGNRGGGQDYNVDGGEVAGASSTSGVNTNSGQAPSSYPPPYPNPMDVPGGYPPHHMHPSHHPSLYGHSTHPSSHGYPPYNSPMFPPNRQYGDMPGDYSHHHPGMPSGSMMHSPYSSGRSPYHGVPGSGSGHHRNSVDYHHPHHQHQPHHSPYAHPQMMGGVRDVPPYPSHGMSSSEWQWQQQQQQQRQQQMMSAQQSQMYRIQQHHHQQQQHAAINAMRQQAAMSAAALQQQQQQQHSSARSSPAISSPDTSKMSWQHHDQSHTTKLHPPSSSASSSSFSGTSSAAKLSSEKARSSPKPHPHLRHPVESLESKISHGSGKSSDLATGPPSASSHASSVADSLKRSLPDWSSCVEGTKPQLVKRRKLFSYHCGHVEPWRLMMSLKSGLLADSTWALDTLTILLHDENTYGYFNLRHHHSLLNTLVDHFKVTLEAIFDIKFEDIDKYLSTHCSIAGRKASDCLEDEVSTDSMLEACRNDYDVLAAKERESSSRECLSKRGNAAKSRPKGMAIPVAETYETDRLKLGKSDVLSHITVSTWEKSLFPDEDIVDLRLVSESKRKELEDQLQLQRVDQTPVNVLLRREALLSQIPFHRFGRLSHTPRRRERNFFGSTRSLDSQSGSGLAQQQQVSGSESGMDSLKKEDSKDNVKRDLKDSSSQEKTKAGSRRESFCKSPVGEGSDHLSFLGRKSSFLFNLKENSPSPVLVEENEVYRKEDLPLWCVPASREQLWKRCETLSNILRSLTFVTGNDVEFCQHPGILIVIGKLLLLHHYHLIRSKQKNGQVNADSSSTTAELASLLSLRCSYAEDGDGHANAEESLPDEGSAFLAVKGEQQQGKQFVSAREEWWWDCLNTLREDAFVILANISGQLDLSVFPEAISFPIINGLLHWLVCPSSVAIDPLPDSSKVYSQSPQRLVVETFAKMTISEANVDLILATPPLMRLDVVFSKLAQMVCQKKHPVVRQFALVLLSNLAQGNECCSRLIAQQKMVISHLLECLEVAEQRVCTGQGSYDSYVKDDPSSLSVAMLRRAATTLYCISRVPSNRTAFLPYRNRILYLSTSQFVEPSVSSILMDMLYEFGKL